VSPTSAQQIVIVAALAKNKVIGKSGTLPWRLPNDLKRFKELTTGGVVVMGRKTYESIGRPLPNRRNLVVSRNPKFMAAGCEIITSLDAALESAKNEPKVFVIGGGDIYRQTMAIATAMELTLVDASPQGDAKFPDWRPGDWWETFRESHRGDPLHPYGYTFITLKRKT
jgi:dihydrofolate reductase